MLAILFLTSLQAQAQINRDKKIEHIAAGYVIGSAGNYLVYKLTDNKTVGLISGVALSLLAGHLKEEYDRRHDKYYSNTDLMYTGIGGIGGSVTIHFVIKKREKKKMSVKDL